MAVPDPWVILSIPRRPHRYGPGKTHALSKASGYVYTYCGRTVYGEQRKGRMSEVTCQRCLA